MENISFNSEYRTKKLNFFAEIWIISYNLYDIFYAGFDTGLVVIPISGGNFSDFHRFKLCVRGKNVHQREPPETKRTERKSKDRYKTIFRIGY